MFFGLDGVEVGLIIVFLALFGGILSGFPVAFAIPGAGVISFAVIAWLDSQGLLIHQAIDTGSQAFRDLVNSGVNRDAISIFRYPDLPRVAQPVFDRGWELAADRNLRDVGQLPLGEQVAAMQGKDWRSLQVYLFCNPLTAARMVEYSPAFAAYLPCRISLVEDGDGQLWLITMNMDLMLYGGRPLPDELREEAEGVRAAMLAVMDGAAEGAF